MNRKKNKRIERNGLSTENIEGKKKKDTRK